MRKYVGLMILLLFEETSSSFDHIFYENIFSILKNDLLQNA